MKVFAPSAFRWPVGTGQDYPFGLQDIGNDTLARALLSAGVVVADDPGDQVNSGDKLLTPFNSAQVAAIQLLAASSGYVIARGAPSLVMNDTSVGAGIVDTPFPLVITIPGGTAPPTSTGMFRLTYCMSMTGGNAKTSTSRVGQAATKTYATATPIGGQSGLSSQISSVFITHLWMISSGVQRGHPANSGSSTSSNSVFALPAMDMALDVNFWIGFQFGNLNGGDTATLLNYMLEYLP
jgi:hypothetical protein